MATFTKRESGKWQAKVRRTGYPPISKTFKTKGEAQEWARTMEGQKSAAFVSSYKEAEKTTLAQLLKRYESEISANKKGADQEKYRIRSWLAHPLAKRAVATLTSSDFAAFRDERLKAGKSPSTVRNDLILVSHLFTVARKEWGLTGIDNPLQHVTKPSPNKGRDRRLRGDEEKRIIKAAHTPLREIIILALETGMRLGEILALTRDRVDLNRRVAHLEDTKNGERRDVPLSPRAIEALESVPRQIKGNDVFATNSSAYVSRMFRELCRELEIEDLRFHDLRHEATSRLFEKGFNPMEVSAITGHKTLHMLKRYTHLKAEDLAARLG